MNLKEKLRSYDCESLEETPVVEVTKEELELANEARLESIESDAEVNDAIETLEEVAEVVVDLQDEIEEALEVVEELSPVEIGKVLGSIEEKAEKILDETEMPKIDQEAWDSDYRVAARVDLEGISDSIAGKVGSFFDMFKSNETLLSKAVENAKGKWVPGNNTRIQDSLNALKDAGNERAEDKKVKLGDKLGSVRVLKLSPKDLEAFAKKVSDLDLSTFNSTTADKAALDHIKSVEKVADGTKLKVTRLDGTKLTVVGANKDDEGNEAFAGYANKSVSSKAVSYANDKGLSDDTIAFAKQLLDSAKVINGELSKVADTVKDEISALKEMVKGDLEEAKWRSSTTGRALKWTAFGVLAGSAVGYAVRGVVRNNVTFGNFLQYKDFVKNLGSKIKATNIRGSRGLGLKIARSGTVKSMDKAIDTIIPVATVAAGGIVGAMASRKNFEELAAKDKIKVIRTRIEISTKHGKDVVHGLNALVNEMVDVANSIIKSYGGEVKTAPAQGSEEE